MVLGEDGPEGGADDIEARVVVGKPLRVALVEPNRQAACVRACPLEEARRDVDARDLGACARCTDRDSAGARGHVEPAHSGTRPEPLDDVVVHVREPPRDPVVVGRAPHFRRFGHGGAEHTGVMSDLFSDAARERAPSVAPLALRLRPKTLDEFLGQGHILGEGSALRLAIAEDRVGSMILYGPPGTGKTTLARIVAGTTGAEFEELSAVSATVADVRGVLARARERLGANAVRTILFLDEIHRFNKAQQDALLPAVEEGLVTLIGATTENPYFEVNSALLSRTSRPSRVGASTR